LVASASETRKNTTGSVAILSFHSLNLSASPALRFSSLKLQATDSKSQSGMLHIYRKTIEVWREDCLYQGRRVARKRKRLETTALPEVMYDSPTGSADLCNVLIDRPFS
jgi:hypothetical protein